MRPGNFQGLIHFLKKTVLGNALTSIPIVNWFFKHNEPPPTKDYKMHTLRKKDEGGGVEPIRFILHKATDPKWGNITIKSPSGNSTTRYRRVKIKPHECKIKIAL